MAASQLPVLNPQTGAASWQDPGGTRFTRFGHVITNQAYEKGGPGDDSPFWQGWRNLSDTELDQLAGEIVNEVKARGPFRSMAEFVNRNPNATTDPLHQLKGPQRLMLRTSEAECSLKPPLPAPYASVNLPLGSDRVLLACLKSGDGP